MENLKVDLRLELDTFSMVGLVIEWVFGFCKFGQVLRCGPKVDFLIFFKDCNFIIRNSLLWFIFMVLSYFG